MTKTKVAPAPEPATLADQKSDFTAEGSPPPGKVSTSPPLTVRDTSQTRPAPSARFRGTITLKRSVR